MTKIIIEGLMMSEWRHDTQEGVFDSYEDLYEEVEIESIVTSKEDISKAISKMLDISFGSSQLEVNENEMFDCDYHLHIYVDENFESQINPKDESGTWIRYNVFVV